MPSVEHVDNMAPWNAEFLFNFSGFCAATQAAF
jgi:hypothetical protein